MILSGSALIAASKRSVSWEHGGSSFWMGNFKNDILGDYIRYTHASCHSYVVVNIDGKILVVNGKNDVETKEIYQRISEKVSKERK